MIAPMSAREPQKLGIKEWIFRANFQSSQISSKIDMESIKTFEDLYQTLSKMTVESRKNDFTIVDPNDEEVYAVKSLVYGER